MNRLRCHSSRHCRCCCWRRYRCWRRWHRHWRSCWCQRWCHWCWCFIVGGDVAVVIAAVIVNGVVIIKFVAAVDVLDFVVVVMVVVVAVALRKVFCSKPVKKVELLFVGSDRTWSRTAFQQKSSQCCGGDLMVGRDSAWLRDPGFDSPYLLPPFPENNNCGESCLESSTIVLQLILSL